MLKYNMLKNIITTVSIIIVIALLPILSSHFSQKEYLEMDREVESSLFERYNEKNLLVFFGYVGCTDICIPRLQELSPIYEKLQNSDIDVQVVFINLTRVKDPNLADLFAKSFHKDFDGIYLQKPELTAIKKEFNIYSAPALGNHDEIDHTSFLYLLKKNGSKYHLNKIYTRSPFSISLQGDDL